MSQNKFEYLNTARRNLFNAMAAYEDATEKLDNTTPSADQSPYATEGDTLDGIEKQELELIQQYFQKSGIIIPHLPKTEANQLKVLRYHFDRIYTQEQLDKEYEAVCTLYPIAAGNYISGQRVPQNQIKKEAIEIISTIAVITGEKEESGEQNTDIRRINALTGKALKQEYEQLKENYSIAFSQYLDPEPNAPEETRMRNAILIIPLASNPDPIPDTPTPA